MIWRTDPSEDRSIVRGPCGEKPSIEEEVARLAEAVDQR
jgi:hypothetical protein